MHRISQRVIGNSRLIFPMTLWEYPRVFTEGSAKWRNDIARKPRCFPKTFLILSYECVLTADFFNALLNHFNDIAQGSSFFIYVLLCMISCLIPFLIPFFFHTKQKALETLQIKRS